MRRVENLLLSHKWIFAKTMPYMPHEYTLRKDWNDKDFIDAVSHIREQGYEKIFGKCKYKYLDIDNNCYWTMGNPIEKTILINRAKLK